MLRLHGVWCNWHFPKQVKGVKARSARSVPARVLEPIAGCGCFDAKHSCLVPVPCLTGTSRVALLASFANGRVSDRPVRCKARAGVYCCAIVQFLY